MQCKSCDAKAVAQGYCNKHYHKAISAGIIAVQKPKRRTPKGLPLNVRLDMNSELNAETGCIEWTGYKTDLGYGMIGISKKIEPAYRVAFALRNGPIPDGLDVLHRCDNPPCINPDHLFLGTQRDNVADMVTKQRHAKGEMKYNAKLTNEQIPRIRSDTRFNREIAADYGVDPTVISRIKRGLGWKHVTQSQRRFDGGASC